MKTGYVYFFTADIRLTLEEYVQAAVDEFVLTANVRNDQRLASF